LKSDKNGKIILSKIPVSSISIIHGDSLITETVEVEEGNSAHSFKKNDLVKAIYEVTA
jgi:hypothetical protein